MSGDYPSSIDLIFINKFDLLKQPVKDLLEHLETIWWSSEWGFKLKGKRILKLELHTGGWSGNEEIIGELRKTMFWALYWDMSRRGGHYYFTIRPIKKSKKKEQASGN